MGRPSFYLTVLWPAPDTILGPSFQIPFLPPPTPASAPTGCSSSSPPPLFSSTLNLHWSHLPNYTAGIRKVGVSRCRLPPPAFHLTSGVHLDQTPGSLGGLPPEWGWAPSFTIPTHPQPEHSPLFPLPPPRLPGSTTLGCLSVTASAPPAQPRSCIPRPGTSDCPLATATDPGACPVLRAGQRGRLVKDGQTPGLPRLPAGSAAVGSPGAGSAAVASWSRAARGGLHWGSPLPSKRELGRPGPGSVGAGATEPRAEPGRGAAPPTSAPPPPPPPQGPPGASGGAPGTWPGRRKPGRAGAGPRSLLRLPGPPRGRGERVPAPPPRGKLRLGAASAALGTDCCPCPSLPPWPRRRGRAQQSVCRVNENRPGT